VISYDFDLRYYLLGQGRPHLEVDMHLVGLLKLVLGGIAVLILSISVIFIAMVLIG